MSGATTDTHIVRIDAAGACDSLAAGDLGGVSLLLEVGPSRWSGRWPLPEFTPPVVGRLRLLAVGPPDKIDATPGAAAARRLSRPGRVLLPALVNPHTHLDLTHIGPLADARGSFSRFIDAVRTRRAVDPTAIAESVRQGVIASLAGGVVAVGDIAGAVLGRPSTAPFDALRELPLGGVSFLEFFAIGAAEAASLDRVGQVAAALAARAADGSSEHAVRPGLQPHAPYSVSSAAYRRAGELADFHAFPLATHLAESPAEREFIARAAGPQREMLETLGIWDDAILDDVAQGRTPVHHFLDTEILRGGRRMLVVHCNDMPDEDLLRWRDSRGGATIVYCPRSSAYFDAPRHFGPHPVRRFAELGIPWVVGTDSILNLDTPGHISPLDDLRLIHRAHLAPAETPLSLIAKATTQAAQALALDPGRHSLGPGAELAGLCGVEVNATGGSAAEAVLRSDHTPELLAFGN